MTIQELYEPLRVHGQTILNKEGFSDVKFTVGHVRHGDGIRLEVILKGPSDRVAQARKVLPFSED